VRLTASSGFTTSLTANMAFGTNLVDWRVTTRAPSGCALPWGGSVSSGWSVTAYASESVVFPATCTEETRACFDGALSGSLQEPGSGSLQEPGCAQLDPCASTTTVGTACRDGSIYAGTSPDGGRRMFTTSSTGVGRGWVADCGNCTYDDPLYYTCANDEDDEGEVDMPCPSSRCSGGEENTVCLLGSNLGYSVAAVEYCATLDVHGHDDWYLPAINELIVLWNGRDAIGPFQAAPHWSSTEDHWHTAWGYDFEGPWGFAPTSWPKTTDFAVRCVRTD
jgi:hypothetical protein